MTRTELEAAVRLAIQTACKAPPEQVDAATDVIMGSVDRYADPSTADFKCSRCDSVFEEITIDELAAVGPPCCIDCGEVMDQV